MTPCARGCVWIDDDGAEQPSEAEYGLLCRWCAPTLHAHLEVAATVAQRLRAEAEPSLRAAALDERVSGSRDQRLLISDAVDAADELHRVVWSWCDEAVRLLGIPGPDGVSARLAGEIAPRGLPAGCDPVTAGQRVSRAADWMLARLEQIVGHPAGIAGDLYGELVPVIRAGAGRTQTVIGEQRSRERPVTGWCDGCAGETGIGWWPVRVSWDAGRLRLTCSRCYGETADVDPLELLHAT